MLKESWTRLNLKFNPSHYETDLPIAYTETRIHFGTFAKITIVKLGFLRYVSDMVRYGREQVETSTNSSIYIHGENVAA